MVPGPAEELDRLHWDAHWKGWAIVVLIAVIVAMGSALALSRKDYDKVVESYRFNHEWMTVEDALFILHSSSYTGALRRSALEILRRKLVDGPGSAIDTLLEMRPAHDVEARSRDEILDHIRNRLAR